MIDDRDAAMYPKVFVIEKVPLPDACRRPLYMLRRVPLSRRSCLGSVKSL